MAAQLDQPESTLVYDYKANTVELYTTSRRLWLRAIKRNPEFLQCRELNPGYILVYTIGQCRDAESVLKPAPGGDEAVLKRLTPEERRQRQAASDRLRINRKTT